MIYLFAVTIIRISTGVCQESCRINFTKKFILMTRFSLLHFSNKFEASS
jgi:hypothetical protein